MQPDDYTVRDVNVREVPFFSPNGSSYMVTRVTIFVGSHGPFTKDFGPNQEQPATADAINMWKQQKVLFVQQTAKG